VSITIGSIDQLSLSSLLVLRFQMAAICEPHVILPPKYYTVTAPDKPQPPQTIFGPKLPSHLLRKIVATLLTLTTTRTPVTA
jgi:hypothetical protein